MSGFPSKKTVKLVDLVSILRSKNAGPLFLGLDIMFKDQNGYQLGKKHITKELIARLYGIPLERVVDLIAYDPGMGIKVAIPRPLICGDMGDSDVYGAQQHVPLLSIELPCSE